MASWIQSALRADTELEELVASRVESKVVAREYSRQDIENIKDRNLRVIEGALSLSDERLEKLRRMCQLWDVQIVPAEISSHRKFIGPIIVGFKRLLFPVVRYLLKDFVRQQRDFNASAIVLLAELSNRESRS